MPAAIDSQAKKQVVNQWLAGNSRDRISADNNIGAGTVTNIVNEWKKGVQDSDYDYLRELAVYSKKGRIRFKSCCYLNSTRGARPRTKSNCSLPIWSIRQNRKNSSTLQTK
jgi:hypothetical protein